MSLWVQVTASVSIDGQVYDPGAIVEIAPALYHPVVSSGRAVPVDAPGQEQEPAPTAPVEQAIVDAPETAEGRPRRKGKA